MNSVINYNPPAYPIYSFPPEVEKAIYEVMEKIKAPDALIATSFLAVMSIACQGIVDVKLPIGTISPVSLNILIRAGSGERKTATDKIVGEPIYAHDEASIVQHQQDLIQYKADHRYWKTVEATIRSMISKAIRQGEDTEDLRLRLDEHIKSEPAPPQSHRFIHQVATEPALMKSLEGEGRSIAIATDEGEVVFKGGLMSRPGLRNKGWDGAKLLVFDRLSTGSIIARQPRITVNLMVQDAVLDVYQQDRGAVARGSGFWARYLVGAPLSTQGFRFINYIDEEWRELPAFHARVKELLDSYTTQRKSGAVKREILEFSPEAAAEWVRLFNHLEGQIQPWQYLNDIHDFASKANEMLARVAAILHHFTKQQGKITKATLDAAVAIVNWHLHEYKRLFSPQFSSYSMQESMMELERFLFINYWKVGLQCVAKNHVLRNGPNHLRSKAALEPVIAALVAQGSITLFRDQGANKIMLGMNQFRFNTLNYC
ncbi:YfjI family protein [Burkholderia sp. LMG 32019]|uniref:YfjI family protein n=1 Tax=Burkholderia sp. LMG 32019 TaxID=3158173 RepID=UPI003C2D292B